MTTCDREFGTTAGGGPSRRNTIELNNTQEGGSSGSSGNCSKNNDLNSRYTKLSTQNDTCKLSVIHANCQSAMNKRSEICTLIDSENPHVLTLTEFGASSGVSDGPMVNWELMATPYTEEITQAG